MAIITKREGEIFRLVDEDTGKIVLNAKGTPIDGGGHKDQFKAERQRGYVNDAIRKKESQKNG
jgi:hypothetical protein